MTSAIGGGFVGAVVLALMLEAAGELRLTRLRLPFLLGSILVADAPRARAAGLLLLVSAWTAFGLLYGWALRALGAADLAGGAAAGVVHGAALAALVVPVLLPLVHPRMAARPGGGGSHIEPPGACGRRYGPWSAPVLIVTHATYGAVVGAFLVAG